MNDLGSIKISDLIALGYGEPMQHSDINDDFLEHHGILGQLWGKRNGPPYPLNKSAKSSIEKRMSDQLKSLKSSTYTDKTDENSVFNSKNIPKEHKAINDGIDKNIESIEESANNIIYDYMKTQYGNQYDFDTRENRGGPAKLMGVRVFDTPSGSYSAKLSFWDNSDDYENGLIGDGVVGLEYKIDDPNNFDLSKQKPMYITYDR